MRVVSFGNVTIPFPPSLPRQGQARSHPVLFSGKPADAISLANPLMDPNLPLETFQARLKTEVDTYGSQKIEAVARLSEVLDLFLQDKWAPVYGPEKKAALLQTLQNLIGPRGQGYMAFAQINYKVGDLLGNARKIMAYIDAAEKAGLDTVVFPEMTITGYPIEDAIGLYPQLADENVRLLKEIAKRTGKTRAIVGFVEPRGDGSSPLQGRKFFNSLAVLGEGKIEGIVRKTLLPNYQEFKEARQIEPSPAPGLHPPETLGSASWGFEATKPQGELASLHGKNYGLLICEEAWADQTGLYRSNPVSELGAKNPDAFIISEASPSRAGKERLKHTMWQNIARSQNKPVACINAVGGNDDVCYDGTSRVYNAKGDLIARAKAFEEQFLIANPVKGEGKIYPLPQGLEKTLTRKPSFDPRDPQDLGRTYASIRLALRDYFHKNGFTKAVLGLSGGIDSAVSATIAVDALGKENVIGFSLPSEGVSSEGSITDAKALADNLGIPLIEVPIGGIFQTVTDILEPAFAKVSKIWGSPVKNPQTKQNAQARIRSLILWAMTNQYGKTLSICTTNKSEALIGNGTAIGDASGGYALLKDISKSKIYGLARWMNKYRPEKDAIPKAILTKEPSAELDDLTDRERYGSDYFFRDEAMVRFLSGQSLEEMVKGRFLIEKKERLPEEVKRKWLEDMLKLFGKNIFKGGILPEGPITDWQGFTKGELELPITISQMTWRRLSDAEIANALDTQQ